jgi:TonB family protein
MKHTAGYAKPRRMAAPRTAPRRKVRLNLQRRSKPEPEDEVEARKKSSFWKWVALVALLHVLALGIVYFVYQSMPAPKPPEQFISLLPEGDVVKGTAGAQEAHRLGPTTAAPTAHPTTATPPPPAAIKPLAPPPILKPEAPPVALDKPIPKPPPKVKVDLTLVDGPATDKPVTKPKHHIKKPVVKPTEEKPDNSESASNPDSTGLSKEQIAAKLGDKLDAEGIKDAQKTGTSGSVNSHPNAFADFYAMIRDQVMSQWQSPNLSDDTAVNPIVEIHVEKDGRVPVESVHLIQSSGNATYDDSALTAAKNLGYLHEPLPDGCPPDIPITFKLNR